MYLVIGTSVLLGVVLGAGGMYGLQRRYRGQELKKIVKMAEDILNEKRIEAAASGEETLCAKAEHYLVRVQEVMQGRRDDAEKSRDGIQKLITEIAHQMRTPLTNMETYLRFLRESVGKEAEEAEKHLKYIAAMEESTEKLHFLVENFIKMSRLEQQVIPIKKEERDILRTVRNALGQIYGQAEMKDIRFQITLLKEAVYLHDPNWLGEAIYNLLDNAVKYSQNGDTVEVSMEKNEMFLKIRIRDYGIGIEAGEENLIFQRFYRGKRVTVQQGYGIGLYLSRIIVNRHGGFLAAKRMEKGLLMEMSFPFVC